MVDNVSAMATVRACASGDTIPTYKYLENSSPTIIAHKEVWHPQARLKAAA